MCAAVLLRRKKPTTDPATFPCVHPRRELQWKKANSKNLPAIVQLYEVRGQVFCCVFACVSSATHYHFLPCLHWRTWVWWFL